MRKIIQILSLAAFGIAGGFSANALTFSDLQLPDKWLNANDPANTSVTRVFDLGNTGSDSLISYGLPYEDRAGFDTATMDAISGTVEFLLYDIGGELNKFSIDLGNLSLIESGAFNYYFYDLSDVDANLLFEINNTGKLQYTVTAKNGSTFKLGGAYLEVEAETTAVPDGGSAMLLLGIGFFAMTGARTLVRK